MIWLLLFWTMSTPHSWESVRHNWEVDGSATGSDRRSVEGEEAANWGFAECSDSDQELPIPPGDEYTNAMLEYLNARVLNATQFCILMHYAGNAGIKQAVKFGHRPGVTHPPPPPPPKKTN